MIYRTFFGPPRRFGYSVADLDSMRRRMDRLFDAFDQQQPGRSGAGVYPAVNITEDTEAFYVSAELPGLQSDDLELNVTDNQLTLAGERKIPEEAADARYHRREREAGRFSRAVALPGDIDTEKVKAHLSDGVLTVTVPKAEKAKPRQIAVQ
ncbi:MAG: Hsp20/alpha crystallin family protein [Desulfosarcina sp.]